MVQYQEFPGTKGDSKSFEKLRALRLPNLHGKSFLDVGCNEGYFCGFALFAGASKATGVDVNGEFIARAKKRYPLSVFLNQGWDKLPDEKFDVILLASALHYAEDQFALIDNLISHLTPDGVLVLELGVSLEPDKDWVSVDRGIDVRSFPTKAYFEKYLRRHAGKFIGESVMQSGDPIPRVVYHIRRRRPYCFLLMNPPHYGKTSIATFLAKDGLPHFSGDEYLHMVCTAPPEELRDLSAKIGQNYSALRIDSKISEIFSNGAWRSLFESIAYVRDGKEFIFDWYIPTEYRALVETYFSDMGYFPVVLNWHPVGRPEHDYVGTSHDYEGYVRSLSDPASVEFLKVDL